MTSDAMFYYSSLETLKRQKKHAKSPVFLYEMAYYSKRSFAIFFGASADSRSLYGTVKFWSLLCYIKSIQ